MGYDDKNQLKDELKRSITAKQLAEYISQKEGKEITSHKDNQGCFYVGDGTRIDQKDGCALVEGFSGHVPGGDVFTVVAHYNNLDPQKDFNKVLPLVCDEFGVNTTTTTTPHNQSNSKDSQKETDKQRTKAKAIYDEFMARNWDKLRADLECVECQELFKARGLDPYKIAICKDVGFARSKTWFYDQWYIPANSLVFCDGNQIKAIPFYPDGEKIGHRIKYKDGIKRDDKTIRDAYQITGAGGSCHWMPLELKDGCDLYFTEGETSAMALIFSGLDAIPLKHDGDGATIAMELAKQGHRIILAYDNDQKGQEQTQKMMQELPESIDISGLWSGEGWKEGADPNDFVASKSGEPIRDIIASEIERQLAEKEKAKADDEKAEAEKNAILENLKTADDVLAYFKAKNDARPHSDCSIRFYNDELFRNFCYSLDPYGIRKFAPVAILVSYGTIRLAKYRKKAGKRILTEQRINNLCAATKRGKDFVLGTIDGSHSLAYQLKKETDKETENNCYSVTIDNAPPTGNGLARFALEFAANDQNKGKVKVIIHPESGNALTTGYDAAKRAGSLSSFDIGLSSRRVDVPKTGTALKEFKDYNESYEFEGVCVRAFQGVNAQKVIIPRFAGGGESRRETWFAITCPTDDEMCNGKNRPQFDDVLDYSFDPDICDKVFSDLRSHALPFNPDQGDYYGEQAKDTINIDTGCDAFRLVYENILETVKNPYFRQDKCSLIYSQFQFMSALCAGLHGHYIADENDYWCAGYIVEVLSRSLDMIAEWDNRPENTESLHAQILEYVERAGVSGVRADSVFRKFPDGKRAISELLAGDDGDGAPIFRMIDANSKKGNAYYFGTAFRDAVEKDNRFRVPIK